MPASASAPYRARHLGTRHMAAAGHYLASQAALAVLEAGGNAVDAGVAGGMALGVLQSEYVSFGGVAPIMIRLAATGETVTISGLGPWPRAARLAHFHEHHGGAIPRGILRTVVPAAPDAWITALARYGTMTFGETAAAALGFARDGFPIAALSAAIIDRNRKDYAACPASAAIYLPDGAPPRPGEIFRQSDLGRTIQYMIDEETAAAGDREEGLEAARGAFYRGDIARQMVRYHRENGGWLAAEDLAEFRSDVERALAFRFGDIELLTCGPWCQGPMLGEILQILDGFDFRGAGHNSPAYIHHLVEASKLAYSDRHHFYGDPKFVDVPIEALSSPDFAAARRAMIDPDRAAPEMPPPGDIGAHAARVAGAPADPVEDGSQLDTSYICVVDSAGNAFSATPSDSSVGSPVIPGLGFVPSSRGSQSWTDPSVPAVLAPGKRPRLTPNPAMARRAGEWVMPFGSPGNDIQPQAMLQVFLNVAVWGMTPQDAVEAPRFGSVSYPRSSEPHAYDPGLLNLEARIDPATVGALAALGHGVKMWPDWEYAAGAVCTIVADERSGVMEGGSDPRRPTGVAGR